ncbi:uncharacterized protein VDAG_04850 [Verticillium dahliae VdLs.17]|uniref:Azaphilone pigments biosynthesis cluster protein L N-terminal domain-containing protein n=1 Tax=Verticillium dahliae (strain VdLs.17 / ATCC MYA-4575 / FGSC 10137) TaxID=498257 RepID=G2X365_VERDV|nr:uncharacterized protein VDAG_04850 [Verticillium dahliae VdLs.17]EGY23412.1 hypothetical protein VDAG_04850 [Verticillium dahliae VdLs.17]
MADGLSIASGVVALITFAFQSSTALYTTVRSFQSQDKTARALKTELTDLTAVLESLLETVSANPDINFEALKLPLYRCGKTCEEYGDLIARCTKHSSTPRPSFRDWIGQQYLKGDISDFKEMLAGYKSTINIALANVNLRVVASITPNALEEYKDLIRDITSDLQEHMQRLDERVQSLAVSGAENPVRDSAEWLAMWEEKESTHQGLRICLQLSAQIEKLESTSKEHQQFLEQPSAHKIIRTGLGVAKGSIRSLVSRLQSHQIDVDKRMQAMGSTEPLSREELRQLAGLQETKESPQQCINVVSEAGQTLTDERCNIFEDITMADNSYGISVSTVKELVVARRINLKDEARYVGGQISDESYQKTIDALTQLDLVRTRSVGQGIGQGTPPSELEAESTGSVGFLDRYGRGFKLSPSETPANPSERKP